MPVSERPTIELLAASLAALNELDRRVKTEMLTTKYERDSIRVVIHLLKRWFEWERPRDPR